jgi:hypothetical protein
MLLQQRTQEAEQELETATSCHQAKIAELNDQCSSLLKTFLALRYQHNDMLQRLAETKVRGQHASCCCCCCGCPGQLLLSSASVGVLVVLPVLLLWLLDVHPLFCKRHTCYSRSLQLLLLL